MAEKMFQKPAKEVVFMRFISIAFCADSFFVSHAIFLHQFIFSGQEWLLAHQ